MTNNFDTAALIGTTNATYDGFEKLLLSVDNSLWDKNPAENSWSVGQVMEHILKANSGLKNLLPENVGETDRAIDEKIPLMKSIFLDFSTKLDAPEFIIPVETLHDKQQQLDKLKAIKKDTLQLIDSLDLSKTCMGFELPVFGHLTRLEWINFSLFHAQRHTEQVRKIIAVIAK
ncbi:DinB family protein [Flavobacterium microcysteis]|uniref:DinB family protein n=1 Tax=Flavobacterium microcysteis TaxID=2596891 RepID=A0A501Q5V0_9FLAO|nr:DinB family protein [Flavobacterium microcysteis]TPD67291.1 DinB family protein [Flavobacterium microcysteis]